MAWEYCGLDPENKPLENCNIGVAIDYALKQYGDILERPQYGAPLDLSHVQDQNQVCGSNKSGSIKLIVYPPLDNQHFYLGKYPSSMFLL